MLDRVKEELPNYNIQKHFTPSYNPWEQRMCLVPNSDLFEAIRQNDVSIVTDHMRFVGVFQCFFESFLSKQASDWTEKGDEIIDWNQSSRSIFNFIRAIEEKKYKTEI